MQPSVVASPAVATAAGPEIALREFAGGQIKKGVRTIGMGGVGADGGRLRQAQRESHRHPRLALRVDAPPQVKGPRP
jgi:hypothetical protein